MQECDLVMKGGTTSGVVYPQAVYKVGQAYRLRSVGGASAGAIAAAVAAAAEYRRQTSDDRTDMAGFKAVAALSQDLGHDLTRFLQPSKALEPLFDAFIAYQKVKQEDTDASWVKLARTVWPYLKPYRGKPLRKGGLIAGGGVLAGIAGAGFGIGALVVGVGVIWGVIEFVILLVKTISAELKENDYGMVPGTTEFGRGDAKTPAISDWLADQIDSIAGLDEGDPLTLGDLRNGRNNEKPEIELATITTDLTSQRPYALPLKMADQYFFNPDEFYKVLPRRIVDYMVRLGRESQREGPDRKKLYPMPVEDAFPVVLMARMSLSFPILLQAIPLYRKDNETWIRCLFSDGGISSNLPVHFFDAWLPHRPTFAISLSRFDTTRHSESKDRVHFDQGVRDRIALPVMRFDSLFGFLFSIFNTAKDWQDTLQTQVPGMYERVVTVRLEPHQGGTNIAMPPEVIQQLIEYGAEAGRKLVEEFDFDENRWRRALVLMPEVEKALPLVRDAILHQRSGPNDWTYEDLAHQHRSKFYPNDPPWPKNALIPVLTELANLGNRLEAKKKQHPVAGGNTPDYDADLRLVASPDLSPGNGSGGSASV